MEPRIWLIAGPTASGKSALALRLAQATGGEIVNADALQLYRDLRLLSARPTPQEEALAPHHLFGIADAANGWSVGRWLRACGEALRQIAARDAPAIVVGGTGLYFRALTPVLAEAPAIPPEARALAAAEFDALGEAGFRARLGVHDPAAAARILPGDRQRLVRAWEVFAVSGTSLSDHQAKSEPFLAPGSYRALALEPPRDVLYDRCDRRLQGMIEEGVLDEVAALLARGLDPALPAMKAVGLRELGRHLSGELTLAQALAQAQAATRRYAKRQMTWRRGQLADWPCLDAGESDAQWGQLLAFPPP